MACLVFAILAAGITGLSAGKILLVWTAGAGAASLSPTPAGIGAVEVAMVAALTLAGVNGPHPVTAILVCRAISLKGAVTIWGTALPPHPPAPTAHPGKLNLRAARFDGQG